MIYDCSHKTRQLVALAKDGDKSALGQLCNVYAERIRWLVRLRIGRELRSKLDSMDVVQDAFINALGGIKDFTYENEGDFIRWLSKIAENALFDNRDGFYTDKRNVHKEVPLGSWGRKSSIRFSGIPGPVATTTPSMIISRKEDLIRLEKAIDALKPEYKDVIVLSKIDGFSYQQIADRTGKSSEAVRKLVCRAITALINAFQSVE